MSLEVSHGIDLAAAPETVFDFLVDTGNFRQLDRALVSYTPAGLMALGTTGTFVHRRGGMTARSTWKVAELVPPNRIRVAIVGAGYEMEETVTLEPLATGTRATFIDILRPTSIVGRLMVALSSGIMRRDLEARATRLVGALGSAASQK
ncbi:MAG TPA: SRPBCC family protein [Candidatus Limnocylindrales bacterium]|nr:SRPBCC family protein [Candidatus Limnocylindrales bacterium]